MSDVFKWTFATILHCALIPSPLSMAQERPPAENASAQRTEAILPDTANKPPQVAEPEATQPTGIYLELPADPALVGTFRRLAEALSVKYKIQILDAGTSASGPELIEAELRLKWDAEFDKVEKIFGTLARFEVARVRLFGPFEDQNMIVINAPPNVSWKLIHDMETELAKVEDFRFDIRVRANENPSFLTFTNSGTTPALPVFGESESYRSPESPIPSNASVPTVAADEEQLKIFHLQHSDANQTAAVIEQLFGGANVTVAVDARTNSLIVRSNEPLLQQIEAILLRLDEQPGTQAPIVNSTTGPTANSTIPITSDSISTSELPFVPIAEYRRRLNALELPLLQLAEKVRSTEASLGKEHAESLKQRARLRESIQKTFAARQEIQRAELAEFTRRLQRMQQSIDARDRIEEKIVDRRVEELLNPEASWDSVLSDMLVASNPKIAQPATETVTADIKLPAQLQGIWEVEELSIKAEGIDISTISPTGKLAVAGGHLVVPFPGSTTITLQYELAGGDPLRVNLTLDPNGSKHRTFGIIKYSQDSLWLCFREPADKGEAPLQESDRPIDFLPGSRNYCIKCRRDSPDKVNPVVPEASNFSIRMHLTSDRSFDMSWDGLMARSPSTADFEIPSNKTSELQLRRIQGADDLEVRMAIEPRYSTPESLQFLQHNDVVIKVKDADIAQLKEGRMVSKALYVSPGSLGVSAIASFAIDAGIDPVDVAAGIGTVIGVIRMSRSISKESDSERIPEPATKLTASDATPISPDEVLTVELRWGLAADEQQELSVRVAEDGSIQLPAIGSVSVGGRTLLDAEKQIVDSATVTKQLFTELTVYLTRNEK